MRHWIHYLLATAWGLATPVLMGWGSQEIIEFFSDFVNNPAPEGMENLSDLVARMGRFMESLKKEGDQTILISTHAIAMKGILEHLTPESHGAYWNKHIANCAVYRTTFSDGAFTVPVELINE